VGWELRQRVRGWAECVEGGGGGAQALRRPIYRPGSNGREYAAGRVEVGWPNGRHASAQADVLRVRWTDVDARVKILPCCAGDSCPMSEEIFSFSLRAVTFFFREGGKWKRSPGYVPRHNAIRARMDVLEGAQHRTSLV
jgi:hypothetical protein